LIRYLHGKLNTQAGFAAFFQKIYRQRISAFTKLGLKVVALTLIASDDLPSRFVVTKVGATVPDGRFFLDFARNLEVIRWFGVRNRYVGPAVGLLVPVVHEAEKSGAYVVGINADEPYFQDLRKLWALNFPSIPAAIRQEVDVLKIIADFAAQFPEDCQPQSA